MQPRRPRYRDDYKADRTVSVLDLVCLMGNLRRGAGADELGFEDAAQTLDQITAKLNMMISINIDDLQSALWSCNLLNERGKFWHPKDRTFDEFLKMILGPGEAFDKFYNLILRGRK